MKFTQGATYNPNIDLIIPIRKDQLQNTAILNQGLKDNIDFKGEFSEFILIHDPNGQRICFLGIGDENHTSQLHKAFRKISFETRKYGKGEFQLDCNHLNDEEVLQAVIGFKLDEYKIGVFKSENKSINTSKKNTSIILLSKHDYSVIINEGNNTGDTINRIKSLVDAPPNFKTPKYLSEWSSESAQKFGYKCEILGKKELESAGFKAILAVGQGSKNDPFLIINSYLPNKNNQIDLGLVGKGITFDSGGLSIKASQNLHYMKSDMGGAAAVFGAVELAARLKLDINVIGIVAAAENSVDANSYRPGDVIGSYSGKTIEIIDTDAEGRLVLADAISYMIKEHAPDQLIDLATLTGSVVRTLAYSAGGMFSKNPEIANKLTKIGNYIHERVWQLPLYSDFDEDIKSDIADIRNFSGKPIAGAIVAAKFLEAFTENYQNWVHLDIAGVAFGNSDYNNMKSATGFGVRLMIEFMKSIIAEK